MGEKKFVWVRGVLFWGIFTALTWSVLMEYMNPSDNILLRPIIALILFPIGGFFWGKWAWKANEKKYMTYKKAQQID
jgi:hypothetical protein